MMKRETREVWMAGFMTSGEGWNGEWPFSDAPTEERTKALADQFEAWWTKRLKERGSR